MLLEQESKTESSTSLRDRAQASSNWKRAELQTNNEDKGISQSKIDFSWAWTLWSVKSDVSDQVKQSAETPYAIVARASK